MNRVKLLKCDKGIDIKGEKTEQWNWIVAFADGSTRRYTTNDKGKGIYEYETHREILSDKEFNVFGYSFSGVHNKVRKIFNVDNGGNRI